MVGWHEKGDNLDLLRRRERDLGKRFAVVRLYQQWRQPSRKVDEMVADGRLVLASHKPPDPRRGGWRAVASGREDRTIRALARHYGGYGREVVFTFHHEPHDDASDVKSRGRYGTSGDFRSAWRRIHRIFVEEGAHTSAGGKVLLGYIATGSQALAGSPAGSADRLYPGDDVVDLLGHDRYNWASCRNDRWEEFEDNWAPLVALAAAQRKPLIIGEFGSPPSGGRRNEWFRDAARWMKEDPQARQWLVGFAYYHSYHDSCHWDFMNQGTDGRLGWIDSFTGDPHFTGTPFSLSALGTAPSPAPAPPGPSEEPAEPAPAPPAAEPAWGEGIRVPRSLPSGTGEMSGLAASRRHRGWAWGVRDSGNPAVLYALRAQEDGRFSARSIPVRGASNRDWEDIVYAEEGGASYLYIIDTGAKKIHKVAEPDPTGTAPARLVGSYRYAFPDASPPGCGPRHNVEAAFLHPPLTGPLHLVRKAKSPAGVYQFGALSGSRTNIPRKVGALAGASCISVASVSADGQMLVTASHDKLQVRRGQGDLGSLLAARPLIERRIAPDNNEGGDFFPWGSSNIVIVAENRTTWSFSRR